LIDFGPYDPGTGRFIGFSPARNNWEKGLRVSAKEGNLYNNPIEIRGINITRLQRISNNLNNNAGQYNFIVKSCSSVASRSLIASGAFVIGGIHPYLLRTAVMLRNAGVRPSLFSYYLNQ